MKSGGPKSITCRFDGIARRKNRIAKKLLGDKVDNSLLVAILLVENYGKIRI